MIFQIRHRIADRVFHGPTLLHNLVPVVGTAVSLVLNAAIDRLVARGVQVIHDRLAFHRQTPPTVHQAHEPIRMRILPGHHTPSGGATGHRIGVGPIKLDSL